MEKKKTILFFQRAGKTVLFLGILAALCVSVQDRLKLNMEHRGTDILKGFYEEEKNSVDVLFLGASTMFCTTDPLVLYEEYGITSYDLGSSAQPFELTYLFLQEALKTQKPKVVGLEVLSIGNELDVNKAESLNYGLTDMPFSKTKALGVYDMFRNDKGKGLSYLIPLVQYKDRWQELTRADFVENAVNYTKGAYTPDKITDTPLDFSSYYEEEEFVIPERNREIFDRIATLCKENDIALFLWKAPNTGWKINGSREVEKLAEEYGLPFMDYFTLLEELDIDNKQDFRDLSHFNRYGSKKASVYMGEFLKGKYELMDWRIQDAENSWDRALRDRERDRRNERLSRTAALSDYMGLIPYEGRTVVFSATGDIEEMADFLDGLAAGFGLDSDALRAGGSFVIKNGVCISGLVGEDGKSFHTGLGKTQKDALQITRYGITYNRTTYQLVDNGLTILVYDDAWEQLVDVAAFDALSPGAAVRPVEE